MKTLAITPLLLILAGCNGPDPQLPGGPTALPALVSDTGSVRASGLDRFMRGKVRWSTTDRSVTARIESPPYDLEGVFLLQVNDRTNSPQRMVGWTVSIPINRGVPVSWTVEDLGCGLPLEAELYASRTPVPNDKISGGYLLASYQFSTPACEEGPRHRPNPPPPTLDVCPDIAGVQDRHDGWFFIHAQGCYRHYCEAGVTKPAIISGGVWYTTAGELDLSRFPPNYWGVCVV